MTTPVIYDISIGKHKPHSGTQTSCPFCHRETLTDILDEKGDIIWLMNKYPVFRNTYPRKKRGKSFPSAWKNGICWKEIHASAR